VSYERQDGMQAAKELRQRLEERGFTLWQDLIALEGGLEWWAQIEQAIKSPSRFLLVIGDWRERIWGLSCKAVAIRPA